MVRFLKYRFVLFFSVASFLCATYMLYSCNTIIATASNIPDRTKRKDFGERDLQFRNPNLSHGHAADEPDYSDWHPHKLAVIVPYRNRFEELMEFVPWIHKFLNEQKVPHRIVAVNQVDLHRFNRAALINIGFLKTRDDCDYLVMHDVDLLPNNPDLQYKYPEKGPFHLASPEYHPMYHYKTYIGGVLMMTNAHFVMCRGMSNLFWGWGREDDELYLRFRENKLTLYRPTGLTTGYETFKHIHDKVKRPRDYKRYGEQKKTQFKKDTVTGFETLQYKVVLERELTLDGAPITMYNVELHCDKAVSPWCDHEPKS